MNPNFRTSSLSMQARVFLLILLSLIAVFLVSNTSVILSRLGFETTTSLKAELVKAQSDLQRTMQINEEKDIELLKERAMSKSLTEQLEKLNNDVLKAKEYVDKVQVEKSNKSKVIISKVKSLQVTNDDTVQLPKSEIDQLSAINIDQVTEVFNNLKKQESV